MDPEILGGLLALALMIGVFARPIVGKLLLNGRKSGNGRNSDRGIERLERGMREGFIGLDKRLITFEERHRKDVKDLHHRIDGLDVKFVTKDTCEVARKSYQGQGG